MSDAVLEWGGALTGLASVILTARRKIVSWPVGLVSVVAYMIFFLRLKLYADSALQCFFFATGLYGWWHWYRGGSGGTPAPIRVLTGPQRAIVALAIAGVVPVVATALVRYTDASLPFWDTTASVLSVAAQLLLMRKIFETWVVWIAVDVLSIGIYAVKHAWVTAGLYAIFLVLACVGLWAWRRALQRGELA